jgi:hypothetical protein
MSARGDLPMVDCAIFADTGAEPRRTYEYLDWLVGVLPFPVHRVSAGNIRDDLTNGRTNGRPPFFILNPDQSAGMSRRQCTGDYKIDPIRKKVRELIGVKPKARAPKTIAVEQWIGISLDEMQRMKDSAFPYIAHRFPLIESRMNRRDCLRWLEERQYPQPPKSACTFCPFHSDDMWRDLRDNDPESWADACAVDVAIRERGKNKMLRGTPFLHRSLKPLSEIDLSTAADRGQIEFGFLQECEGMCGV